MDESSPMEEESSSNRGEQDSSEQQPPPAAEEEQPLEPRRWTCEACGCNTNIVSDSSADVDRTCSVCGTSQSHGSSLLRRSGFAARAGLFARTVAARRSLMNEEMPSLEGYELWSRAMEGDIDMEGVEDDEHALAALAMEVAGVSSRNASFERGSSGNSRSIVDAARSFALATGNREQETRLEPEELWRAAAENGNLYQPKWMNPSQIGGRMRTGNGIEVGDGDSQNVAYLPLGAGEGRALRALEAFPRSAPFASFNRGSESTERKPRRVFGFTVAFDHPKKEKGKNMGGCYLIGVTTTSFAAFSERNALQQSPFFWGIEDSGNKYEGSRHQGGRETQRRSGQPSYSTKLNESEAPRNEDAVLFGSREVITCVVDLESRSLTFWRNEGDGENKLLGTLVTGIPRGGQLYPIVVPYNAGSTVAITGMGGDPLPLLNSFVENWRETQALKVSERWEEIHSDRSTLIENGLPTSRLLKVLHAIFGHYVTADDGSLGRIEASRLWYRCGLKLSSLNEMFEIMATEEERKKGIEWNDFLGLVQRITTENEKMFPPRASAASDTFNFEVGEKVELVDAYERFGDAANGPLSTGDRGSVIELQRATSGEISSVRVLYNGRRWWYQPNCIVGEKSGLIDPPAVWFLKRTLRIHGYNPKTLEKMVGTSLSASSWRVGDLVVPKKMAKDDKGEKFGIDDAVGRVVPDSSASGSMPPPSRSRGGGSVMVEFVSPTFAEGASVQIGSTFTEKSLESRRIPMSRLVHTSVVDGINAAQKPRSGSLSARLKKKSDETKDMETDDDSSAALEDDYYLDGGILADLQGMKYLDPTAITRVIKECDKTSSSLNALFEARLTSITLEALDCVHKNIQLAVNDESIIHAQGSLGRLALLIAQKAFATECHTTCVNGKDASAQTSSFSQTEALHNSDSTDVQHDESSPDRHRSSTRSQSLQERRRMLLTLMSRARRGDIGSLGELLNRDIVNMPSIDIGSDTAAFVFGGSGDVNSLGSSAEDRENGHMENSRPRDSHGELERSSPGITSFERTFLDDVFMGRDRNVHSSSSQGKWMVPISFVSTLIEMGILGNSVRWLQALVYSLSKKIPRKQSSRSTQLLKEATDEDGTPLLALAILLGCSVDVIRALIQFGCPVGASEIKSAAENDLPDVLAALLRFKTYKDGIVDLNICSPAVVTVVKDAVVRQETELTKLRKEAGEFLIAFFRKLVQICFSRRWQQQDENDVFGRSVIGTLVGNVELCAFLESQKLDDLNDPQPFHDHGHESVDITARGLLQILPTDLLGKALVEDSLSLTTILLLAEDFLCSKGVNEGGVGLIILLTLLQRFPALRQSHEMERYGFAELVSSHDALASNKIAAISSCMTNTASAGNVPGVDLSSTSVVLCPKKHHASIHVTKHASFRCDLCGKGVDKGSIMHGCRQCDWDACEACTDKCEGGIVKWKYIRDLASQCQDMLCQEDVVLCDRAFEDNAWSEKMVENLKSMDNTTDINTLSIRLLQRDPSAVRALATFLSNRGQITIHQFLMVILPALHSSLMGKNTNGQVTKSSRRSKKPRVAGTVLLPRETNDSSNGSEEERLQFASEVLKHLIRRVNKSNSTGIEDAQVERHQPTENIENEDDSDDSDDDDEEEEDGVERATRDRTSERRSKTNHLPGFIRRLHQVLSLHEEVVPFSFCKSSQKDSVSSTELRSLKKPIKVILSQSNKNNETIILAEPLVSVEDITHQLFKTALRANQQYATYCQTLANDNAVIIERSPRDRNSPWRIAKVVSYDCTGGWHSLIYASSFAGRMNASLHLARERDFSRLNYDEKTARVMLSSREYAVLYRQQDSPETKSAFDMEHFLAEGMVGQEGEGKEKSASSEVVGARVESDFVASEWRPHTVVAVDSTGSIKLFDLVSDDGEVVCGVPNDRIRGLGGEDDSNVDHDILSHSHRSDPRNAEGRQQLSRVFPFLSAARRQLSGNDESGRSSGSSKPARGTLKRAWSALGPLESMHPVEVTAKSTSIKSSDLLGASWNCQLGDKTIQVFIDEDYVDAPPTIKINFVSSQDRSPIKISSPSETTLVSLLCQLHHGDDFDIFENEGHQISYMISLQQSKHVPRFCSMKKEATEVLGMATNLLQTPDMDADDLPNRLVVHPTRSRKLSDSATLSDDEDGTNYLPSDGLDEICVQCLEIIEYLAEVECRHGIGKKEGLQDPSLFVNQGLSQKLSEQLENPLIVVGGAIPSWCLSLPSFSPHVFTYASRKLLLDRVAFGVSRSTLKQQEAKVNVGRLRQRMTSLRARAVELVGEAFSTGAEDPTALQLQADELYGMEEALGARIRASFRAEGWQEQSIEVAKAAVHRECLIEDAMSIMEQYANDPNLNRRRLEVRFDGESGFDAASGDEAGVTRGFYADVAEALLSCDAVAGVILSLPCPVAGLNSPDDMDSVPFHADGKQKCKLPLWIPDVDSTHKVIIPTPRASPSSVVGIYPRPISKLHPQYTSVLHAFRFMGRVFAAAMRDGFMFPLPLSASFLKLVQRSGTEKITTEGGILSSLDLPRPGFTGGEVYAVETHICASLDKIDNTQPPLAGAELEQEYRRIATDKTFAQVALGMNYECSFADYFEDRTFVDPLDPSQGLEAHPLCQNGHIRHVTIHNVREWVVLAKDYILHDGVIGQAVAFRAGINDFFSSDYLCLFTSEELQRDVCGVGDNVDNWNEADIRKLFKLDGKGATEALVAVAAIGGNAEALSRRFGPTSPTIKFVIKALLEASPTLRRQFLSFVTSVPIVTPGQIEVVPVVSSSGEFLPMKDPGCLPRANTCARRLYLPKFESYESFKSVLWAVVEEEFKHKGFFEWSL